MFRWFDAIGVAVPIAQLRVLAAGVRHYLPRWVLFSAPNALWVYSFTAFMTELWHDSPVASRFCWLLAGPAVGVGLEVAQAYHLVRGPFDVVDVVLSGLAGATAFVLVKRGASGGGER